MTPSHINHTRKELGERGVRSENEPGNSASVGGMISGFPPKQRFDAKIGLA